MLADDGVVPAALAEANHLGARNNLHEQLGKLYLCGVQLRESDAPVDLLQQTPGSALGSSRIKLNSENIPRVLEVFKKYNICYFFGIGGDDTQLNVYEVEKYCKEQGTSQIN